MAERDMPSPQNIHSSSTAYCLTSTAHQGQNDATSIIPVSTSVVDPAAPSHAIVSAATSHTIVLAAASHINIPVAVSHKVQVDLSVFTLDLIHQ